VTAVLVVAVGAVACVITIYALTLFSAIGKHRGPSGTGSGESGHLWNCIS